MPTKIMQSQETFPENRPKHFIGVSDLLPEQQLQIMERTAELSQLFSNRKQQNTLENRIVLIFAQKSGVELLGYEIGARMLGARVICSGSDTSLAKGESIGDTMRVLSSYADLIVFQHSGVDMEFVASFCEVPVINAGDIQGEQPISSLQPNVDEVQHPAALKAALVEHLLLTQPSWRQIAYAQL